MYPEMRRRDRAISQEDVRALLEKGEYGVMASVDEAGRPYATPLSYVYMEGAIYFHSAMQGQKLTNIAAHPGVCFTVVGETQPVFDDDFTTYFESVMAFGEAALVQDAEEKRRALLELCRKYLPAHMDQAEQSIAHSFSRTAVVKISVAHTTGKAKQR